MDLDEKDKQIISILRNNSRETNTEIAKKVDLTEGAVRNRIHNLTESGAIQRFTIETTAGSFFGVVMVKAKKDVKLLVNELHNSKIAKESYEISGDYDACVILEGESLEQIDSKIDLLRKLKAVADTKTFISFRKW
jgi:Lrp/AsnC family transcriptional regulator of lysine biosynthesis